MGSLSLQLPLITISLVLLSLITIPYFSQNLINKLTFLMILTLLVASKTVSSININRCSHDKKPSGSQVSFSNLIRSFTYKINNKHNVGPYDTLGNTVHSIRETICSIQPRPLWAPACSQYCLNQSSSLLRNTISNNLAIELITEMPL